MLVVTSTKLMRNSLELVLLYRCSMAHKPIVPFLPVRVMTATDPCSSCISSSMTALCHLCF